MAYPGYIARLQFTGRFDLELTDDCDSDYVEVQSWNSSTNAWSRVGDRLCGRTTPDVIITPSGRSRIIFESNQAVNGDGFSLNWNLGMKDKLNLKCLFTSPYFLKKMSKNAMHFKSF